MSHEIRTPLNGIIGYNQLLMQTQLTLTQQSYLNALNQCSVQLLAIINDIIDFSKLSTGNMPTHNECFTMKEVIDSVQNAMCGRINDKRQKIKYNVIDRTPTYVILDKQKFIQILINLISNASKFTDIGGCIEVVIDSFPNMNTLHVAVKDNGIGIREKDQCKLFTTFMQTQQNMTKSTSGSGLGLAISKKMVEILGGDIKVDSTLGLGSTFSFTVQYEPYLEFEKKMNTNCDVLLDKYVLVVDDNADNRIFLTEMLFEWKMNPIVCASGLEALRMVMCKRYTFSLGLIDICMPGKTGPELAKQIKEEYPLLPLVALSSIDTYVNFSMFDKKLDKPINRVQLFDTIYRLLSKSIQPSAYIGEKKVNNNLSQSLGLYDKDVHILVVEDVGYNRTLLISMLNNLSYHNIDDAKDGAEAVSKIKQSQPYDIILLDLRMPNLDGYEVLDNIYTLCDKIPKIVVVTASVMNEDKERCRMKGIEYFINKPFQLSQIKEVMLHLTKLN